jgi:hypothetical protein
VEDRIAGPYRVSVWSDPDIGIGTFHVILDAPENKDPSTRPTVRIGVRPVSGRLQESIHEAAPKQVRRGVRYYAEIPLDRGELWSVRITLDGPLGSGEVGAEVEATPEGTIGPVGLLIYLIPFVAAGILWWKAVAGRRARRGPNRRLARPDPKS